MNSTNQENKPRWGAAREYGGQIFLTSVQWVRVSLAWLFIFGPLLLFGELAEDIIDNESFRYDDSLLLWLHSYESPGLNAFMQGLSWAGGTLGMVPASLLILFWLLHKRRRRDVIFTLASMTGICALNLALKMVFQRERPALWLSIAPEPDYSFPSGHSMLSSAFVIVVFVLVMRSGASVPLKWTAAIVGAFFAGFVGLSRMYLGVHYPTDVVAAWTASLCWIALVDKILPSPRRVSSIENQHEKTNASLLRDGGNDR